MSAYFDRSTIFSKPETGLETVTSIKTEQGYAEINAGFHDAPL